MTVPMPRLLRQVCWGLVVVFPLLALFGQHWQRRASGDGTQVVMALVAVICPTVAGKARSGQVGDGARALDRAALTRIATQFGLGPGCSRRSARDFSDSTDQSLMRSQRKEEGEGNGKSM